MFKTWHTNQLKWCCFINFVFQADLHGLSFLTLRDGPPTVTDRTDQEFSGPIGSKLHLRRLHPTNYICTKYFSAFLRSLAIFLAFWHFPQYFPSPLPLLMSEIQIRVNFSHLTFSLSNVLLKNWSNMAACQMVRWTKKVGYGSAKSFLPNFQDNPNGT